MPTELLVSLLLAIFLGLFQFGVSRLMKRPRAKEIRETQEYLAFRMWGLRSLLFAIVFLPVLIFRQDDLIFVMLVYVGLSVYNSSLLRKGIRKIRRTIPASVPDIESKALPTQTALLENPLDFDEEVADMMISQPKEKD